MTREERELSITYLEEIKEKYIEGEGYERHPLPEYYAIEMAIEALEQEPVLDKIRAEIKASIDSDDTDGYSDYRAGLWQAIKIIDKYKEGGRMTREEAIRLLNSWDGVFIGFSSDEVNEAIKMATEALKETDVLDKMRTATQIIDDTYKACEEE